MEYILLNLNKFIEHSLTGFAKNKDWSHEKRIMNEAELMIITKGEIFIKAKNSYVVKENECLILLPNIEHKGYKKSDYDLYFHHFKISDYKLLELDDIKNKILELKSYEVLIPIQSKFEDISNLIFLSEQIEQLDVFDNNTKISRDALMTVLLNELYLNLLKNKTNIQHKRLNSIISYIDNNFLHKEITVKHLAEMFNYSEKYIFRLFKKELGISPLQYIIKQKTKEARRLLLTTDETIESIAIQLNYNTPQYFMRQFRLEYGLTPSNLRKKYSKSLELYLSDNNNE